MASIAALPAQHLIANTFRSLPVQATGHCHNSLVQACGLWLHENEPADNLATPFRTLRYPPKAVLVRPVDNPLDAPAILEGLPGAASTGAVFAVPFISSKSRDKKAAVVKVRLPLPPQPGAPASAPQQYQAVEHKVLRWNMALSNAYVVTDYFCQGRTFGSALWLADLTIPPRGINRATWFVILSRFRSLAHLRLLRPICTPATRDSVVDTLFVSLDPSSTPHGRDLQAELQRLHHHAYATVARCVLLPGCAAHPNLRPPCHTPFGPTLQGAGTFPGGLGSSTCTLTGRARTCCSSTGSCRPVCSTGCCCCCCPCRGCSKWPWPLVRCWASYGC